MRRHLASLVLLAGIGAALAAPAMAQPSEEAADAVRSSCRGDYIAHCMSVPRGGREALDCLQRNQASVSAGCRHALAELEPGLSQQCATHIREICPGMAQGSGQLVACLTDRRDSLGAECRAALDSARGQR